MRKIYQLKSIEMSQRNIAKVKHKSKNIIYNQLKKNKYGNKKRKGKTLKIFQYRTEVYLSKGFT